MGAEKAMRKRAMALFTLFCILLPLFFCLPAKAAAASTGFSAELSPLEGEVKDRAELTVSYDGRDSGLGAFLLQVEYDSDAFEYLRAEEGELLEEGSVTVLPGESSVSVCCVTKENSAPKGTALTFLFKVKEGAPAGEAKFLVSVSQAADREGGQMEGAELPLTFSVLPPPSAEATLSALRPAVGELTPAFSPDHYDYAMSVPFSVTSLDFTAKAAEGAVYRVNRKNLGAGGSDTDFLLTVTAADGKTKSTYKVTVHRAEKPTPSPKPTPTPKPTSASSQGSAHTVRTPVPKKSPTPRPKATKKPSPTASATVEPNTGFSAGGKVQPSVVIYNGSPSAGPIVAAIAVMTATFLLSGPLSSFLTRRIAQKKEKLEEEKSDENKQDPNV